MMQPNGQPQAYKVVISEHLAELVEKLHEQADAVGIGAQFIDALQTIYDQLRVEPRRFGDPLYRLPAMKLLVYMRALFPLVVDYGVHDDKPLVFIKGVRLIAAT